MKQFISDWIEMHRDDIIRDIGRLVGVKSVKGDASEGMPFGEGPAKALETALEICRGLGFSVINHEGYVGTADAADAPRGLDILCHLDVVGEGSGWDTDPYECVLMDGCVWGRGTDDDKGPAVAAIYAMKAVMECGMPMKKNVRLILGTDEESGSSDIEYYYRTKGEAPAPSTFSPDNAFPVYNVEKGLYRQGFSKQFSQTSVLPRVTRLEGGFRFNVIPPDASARVEGLEDGTIRQLTEETAKRLGVTAEVMNGVLSVHGTSSHSSEPEGGNNALTALLSILECLPLADAPSTRAVSELRDLFPHGDYYGRAVGISMQDEISGPLTLAFSVLKMDDTGVRGIFDCRTPLCADDGNCREVVQKTMSSLGYDLEGEMIPPHYTPEDSEFVQTLLRAYETYTGEPGRCIASGGATYCHSIPGGVAFGAHMPGVNTNLHSANEHMPVSDLLTASKIFAQVIYDICCA